MSKENTRKVSFINGTKVRVPRTPGARFINQFGGEPVLGRCSFCNAEDVELNKEKVCPTCAAAYPFYSPPS